MDKKTVTTISYLSRLKIDDQKEEKIIEDLDNIIKDQINLIPSLFICVGMQILFESSEEFGFTEGLGIINGSVKKIPNVHDKKEIKLKYELEKNVNLVKFEKNIIEISFNENLDKNFVKELSSKLFDWTGERWMISFSQLKGEVSMKKKKQEIKKSLIDKAKSSKIYKDVIKNFPDAELIDVNLNKENEPHD